MFIFSQLHTLLVYTRVAGQQTQLVSQTYCSAISCAYGHLPLDLWEPMATLVLDAAYEATLWAAVVNAHRTGCSKVYLTSVGGGVFGNKQEWIANAIARAIAHVSQLIDFELQVYLVHYRDLDMKVVRTANKAVTAMAPQQPVHPSVRPKEPSINFEQRAVTNQLGLSNEMTESFTQPLLGWNTVAHFTHNICFYFDSVCCRSHRLTAVHVYMCADSTDSEGEENEHAESLKLKKGFFCLPGLTFASIITVAILAISIIASGGTVGYLYFSGDILARESWASHKLPPFPSSCLFTQVNFVY